MIFPWGRRSRTPTVWLRSCSIRRRLRWGVTRSKRSFPGRLSTMSPSETASVPPGNYTLCRRPSPATYRHYVLIIRRFVVKAVIGKGGMVAKTHVTIDSCRNNLQKVVTDESSGERRRQRRFDQRNSVKGQVRWTLNAPRAANHHPLVRLLVRRWRHWE